MASAEAIARPAGRTTSARRGRGAETGRGRRGVSRPGPQALDQPLTGADATGEQSQHHERRRHRQREARLGEPGERDQREHPGEGQDRAARHGEAATHETEGRYTTSLGR